MARKTEAEASKTMAKDRSPSRDPRAKASTMRPSAIPPHKPDCSSNAKGGARGARRAESEMHLLYLEPRPSDSQVGIEKRLREILVSGP